MELIDINRLPKAVGERLRAIPSILFASRASLLRFSTPAIKPLRRAVKSTWAHGLERTQLNTIPGITRSSFRYRVNCRDVLSATVRGRTKPDPGTRMARAGLRSETSSSASERNRATEVAVLSSNAVRSVSRQARGLGFESSPSIATG
jgi:hypothetical protein